MDFLLDMCVSQVKHENQHFKVVAKGNNSNTKTYLYHMLSTNKPRST